ncbi:hypothetical protein OESDEN_15162, partial [Oesophagostomum dentatum]
MYRQENEQWTEEEKVSATGPRHLVVPETLARLIDEATGWPAIMAFDAALIPLTINISDEERVAYCDALPHAVSTALPQILARCPEDMPSSLEREYFISDRFPFSPHVYERYAANLLYRTLGSLPAVVRNWYAGLPNSGTQIVSKYVRYYVSKLLVEAELNKVKAANKSHLKADKSLKIRVVPVSGEVIAEYTVEETTMRLSIVMPQDWPLSVPSIQIDKAIVPSEKVKKWLLQLTAYLFHQNGSTVEGIIMWRKNVDRDVEGAEACTICMMTIHSTNHQLPKVKCRQCKNKFHSNCLPLAASSLEREYFISDRFPFSPHVYERYAANLLYRTLGSLPAVVRNWYAGLPNSGTQIVSKYVRYYVSKLLVEAELNKVKAANKSHLKADKSLKIRVVPVSGEVIAEYTVEETTMRLSIVMPQDWPLSVPSIQIDKAIVPSE